MLSRTTHTSYFCRLCERIPGQLYSMPIAIAKDPSMNLKKSLYSLIVTAFILCSATYWGSRQLFVTAVAASNLNVRPFVMEQVQYRIAEGAERPVGILLTARRRDGAKHILQRRYQDGKPGAVFRRIELPDGTIGTMNDSIQSKSTARVSEQQVAALKQRLEHPPQRCLSVGEKVDGEDYLFGYRAFRILRQEHQDSIMRVIEWRIPEFSCTAVQGMIQRRTDAAADWQTTNGNRLTAFAEADPDPKNFTNFENYSEMSPSDLKRKFFEANKVTKAQCPRCFADEPQQDKTYFEGRER